MITLTPVFPKVSDAKQSMIFFEIRCLQGTKLNGIYDFIVILLI